MVKNIYQKLKSVLFTDPGQLFREEKDLIKQPFYFPGTNGNALLLIHGWTAVPYEVRRLGKFLNENGYTVCAPMLSGHGTVPTNLENVKWTDWLRDITSAYNELKINHSKIFVGGTSIGANLTAMLAKNNPDISGLIFMAMPYKIKLEKLVIVFARFIKLFGKYRRKIYPPTFGASTTITRLLSYQTYPIESALETFELIKISRRELYKIKQPCFIIQSKSDHVVSGNSLEKIYERISSKIKRRKYIAKAYHTFISDVKNENVFKEILEFIEEN